MYAIHNMNEIYDLDDRHPINHKIVYNNDINATRFFNKILNTIIDEYNNILQQENLHRALEDALIEFSDLHEINIGNQWYKEMEQRDKEIEQFFEGLPTLHEVPHFQYTPSENTTSEDTQTKVEISNETIQPEPGLSFTDDTKDYHIPENYTLSPLDLESLKSHTNTTSNGATFDWSKLPPLPTSPDTYATINPDVIQEPEDSSPFAKPEDTPKHPLNNTSENNEPVA